MRVILPIADIRSAPNGPRARQLQFGAAVRAGEAKDGWVSVVAERDGYAGFVREDELADLPTPSHRVSARATHVCSLPDFKSQEMVSLGFGAQVLVDAVQGKMTALVGGGFIPTRHLSALPAPDADPVKVAEKFLGTPYLWGGNSVFGIDCSGLVQAALHACGMECPGDSGPQMALGQDASGAPERGDLLFWKGHVAMVVDADRLIHANAFHMAVAYENYGEAIDRIEAQGDGPVTAHRRL